MKNLLFILLSSICIFACKPDYDTFEAEPIEGKVQITDIYTQTPPVIAAGAAVYLIAENSGDEAYYYKTLTNVNGEFVFSHRPNGKSLCVRAELTKDSIKYVASALAINGLKNTPLTLMPRYPGGKLKIIVKDANQHPINGMDVYLFINQAFAASIKETNVSGYIKNKTTNSQGVVFFYGLEPDDYFVTGKRDKQLFEPVLMEVTQANFDNYNQPLVKDDFQVIVPVTPIAPIQLQVKTVDKNSIVTNGSKEPLNNIEVYLFSSKVQADNVKNLPITQSPASWAAFKTTNTEGLASFTDLIAGKEYYVAVRDKSGLMKTPNTVMIQAVVSAPMAQTVEMEK